MKTKESVRDITLVETDPLKEQAAVELGRRAIEAARERAEQPEAGASLPKSA